MTGEQGEARTRSCAPRGERHCPLDHLNNKQNVQSSCNGQERHESTEQDYEHYITCIDVAVRNGGVGFLFPVGSTFFLLVVIRSYYRPKTFMVNQV